MAALICSIATSVRSLATAVWIRGANAFSAAAAFRHLSAACHTSNANELVLTDDFGETHSRLSINSCNANLHLLMFCFCFFAFYNGLVGIL